MVNLVTPVMCISSTLGLSIAFAVFDPTGAGMRCTIKVGDRLGSVKA